MKSKSTYCPKAVVKLERASTRHARAVQTTAKDPNRCVMMTYYGVHLRLQFRDTRCRRCGRRSVIDDWNGNRYLQSGPNGIAGHPKNERRDG